MKKINLRCNLGILWHIFSTKLGSHNSSMEFGFQIRCNPVWNCRCDFRCTRSFFK